MSDIANPTAMARCQPGQIEIEATGQFRTRFLHRVPAQYSIEQVLSPEYFGLVINTQKMEEGDLIEVEWEDLSRHGMLQVRAVEPSLGLVMTRERTPVEEVVDFNDMPDGWTMKWAGSKGKWQVLFGDKLVDGGYPTPERARNRIAALSTQNATRRAMSDAATAPVRGKPGPKPKSEASPPPPPAAT